MKGNYTSLSAMALEVERVEANKQDFLTNGASLLMVQDSGIGIENTGTFNLTDYAHGQVASKLNIPKSYYDRMGDIEGLRSLNVNAWLRKEPEQKHFIRTIDGKARALLSNAFRPIDNYDVLSSFLPVLKEREVEITSSSLTDKKMYLQVSFKNLEGEVKPGDVVRHGIVLTNSEVGAGAVDIKTMIWRLVCSNGLIRSSVLRKMHVGSRIDTDNADIFKDETIRLELAAFNARMKDVIEYACSPAAFADQLETMRAAAEDRIKNVTATVQNVTKRFNLSEKYNDAVIENMVNQGNLNRWGLINGLTNLCHSIESPDTQYEIEKVGGRLLEVTRSEWNTLIAA